MGAMSADAPPSPLDAALTRVGDRWALLLVDALQAGPRRFNDLIDAVPGIASNVLSQRLKHLEREGVVLATPYCRRPPRFDYRLTAAGLELVGVLRLLASWGAAGAEDADPVRHGACGTAMDARWYCATCERSVDAAEDADLHYL